MQAAIAPAGKRVSQSLPAASDTIRHPTSCKLTRRACPRLSALAQKPRHMGAQFRHAFAAARRGEEHFRIGGGMAH